MNIYKVVTISLLALISACSAIKPANKENQVRLHDIWALEKMQGERVSIDQGMQRPQLEIYLKDMRIVGNDGCNDFSGSIRVLNDNDISFGPVMGTKMFCPVMELSNQFNSHINSVHSYVIKDLTLYLFNDQGGELLSFRKID